MNLNLQLVTPPAAEPVTLAQAKNFLNVDSEFTQDDALIGGLITAARQFAESYTNRAFFNQQWLLTLDTFPIAWPEQGTISQQGRHDYLLGTWWTRQLAIQLPKPVAVSVDSITYVDAGNNLQTLSASAYVLDTTSEPARVVPAAGTCWPTSQVYLPGSVRVKFTAGSYGDGATVNTIPQTVCTAILLLVGHWYQNREASSQANLSSIPFGVGVLLDTVKFTVFSFGDN